MAVHGPPLSFNFPQEMEPERHVAHKETEAQHGLETPLSLGVAGAPGTWAKAPPLPF